MKKYHLISLVLSISIVCAPLFTRAVTVAELQLQLNALVGQLAQLQASSNAGVSTSPTGSAGCTLYRNLGVGVRGADVECLQRFLIDGGFLRTSATGYFGPATKIAVSQWQLSRGVSATGYFGPLSRGVYASLVASIITPPAAPSTPSAPLCAQVMHQCSDGSLVGYRPGTCTYYDCPVVTPPATSTQSQGGSSTPAPSASGLPYGTLRTSAVMGSANNDVLRFRLVNDNVADVRLTDLIVTDSITNNSGTRTSFVNFYLDEGGAHAAGPLQMTMSSGSAGTVSFSLPNQTVVIPRNSSRDFIVRADVADASSGGAVSGSVHTFGINTAAVRAVPTGTVASVNMGSLVVLPIIIRAANQEFSAAPLGVTTNRVRTSVDDVAQLTIAAEGTNSVGFSTLRLTLSGGALSGASAFGVQLIDPNTNVDLGAATTQTCTPSSSSCTVLFSPSYTISAGTVKPVKIRLNSSGFNNSVGSNDALSIMIASTADMTWTDGVTTAEIAPTLVPFTLATLGYE